jgi:crotonobetainyl-CoA:carnitine CoA-transferase CaiB-like acyl-CoA transferase
VRWAPTLKGRDVAGALDNLRVVDFGHYYAGPLTAVMLADQGADVIHVDGPHVSVDDPADAFLNHGKRRITLDLTTDADREVALDLIRGSDVVVENFRPGVMERLGLGWEAVQAIAPHVVYCSLPGFAADDPRAGVPAWEGVVDAASGNCRLRAGEEPPGWDTARPTYSAVPVASNFAAFLAALGIVTALTERLRSGLGQRIEVPLFNAVFEAVGDAGSYVTAQGLPPKPNLRTNGSGTFRCGDGRYVQFNPLGSTSRFMVWFLHAAGVTQWTADGLTDGARLQSEPGLGTELSRRIAELMLTRSAAEWEDLAANAGVPLAMIRTSAEWLANDHARASEAVVCRQDPLLGETWMAGLPVQTTGTPAEPTGPRHLPDADREEILAELAAGGRSPKLPAPAKDGSRRPPYDGLRVIDLTQILAGPSSGRLLAEFGADVVKINYPKRWVGAHGIVNRGKRSVLIDVESPEGQEMFWALVDQADVVVQNFPYGTAERYGIGYDHVRARKPDIVYVSVSCYGYAGPWRSRRGYETQGQAATGIVERVGTPEHGPGVLGPYNLLDYGTGVMAAFGGALGIYRRAVDGTGQHVYASLAQTGTYQQAPFLLDFAGKRWDEPRGPGALGTGPLQRFYQAADGWFFLGARGAQLADVSAIVGLPEVPTTGVEQLLEERFLTGDTAHWVDRLTAAGIGAHRLVELDEMMVDPWARAHGLSVVQDTDEAGEVTMPGIAMTLSATPPQVGRVGRPGEDAAAVLAEVGLADSVERFEQAWALQTTHLPLAWTK